MTRYSLSKRIISLILSLMLLIGSVVMSSTVVYAAGEASIESTEYETFAEAVAAARNGDIIVVNKDVVVDSTLNVTKTLTVRSEGQVSISRGNSLSGSIFDVSGSLTVMGVKLNGVGVTADSAIVTVSGGTFTMREGSSVTGGTAGGVSVDSGSFNFYGGTISSNISDRKGNGIYLADYAVLRMSGNASLGSDSTVYMPAAASMEIAGPLSGQGEINVRVDSVTEGDRIATIGSSVTISSSQLIRFKISDGNKVNNVSVDKNTLVAGKSAGGENEARIGDVEYATLGEAFDAAANVSSATITLTSDVSLHAPITVKGNITLDSDGNYTVRAEQGISGSAFVVSKGSSLRISDPDNTVTLSGSNADSGSALVDVRGAFTLGASVTITGNVNTTESVNKGAVYVNGGSFNMTGGAVSGNISALGTVYIAAGSFVMSGGSVYNNKATAAGGVYVAQGSFSLAGGSVYANSGEGIWNAGSLTLSGTGSVFSSSTYPGTVFLSGESRIKVANGWKPADAPLGYTNIVPIASEELKLYRVVAEFDTNAEREYFTVSDRYEGKFALMPKDKNLIVAAADEIYSVYWENKSYMTLEEAIADIPKNTPATLRVVNDTVISAPVVIKEGMNIIITTDANPATLAEYTERIVKRSSEFKDSMFVVEKGATLTLAAADNKKLTFDGENKVVTHAMIVTSGALSVGKGVTLKGNNNKASEVLTGTTFTYTFGGALYVEQEGSCTINGGILQGNYASYGGGAYVKDSALTLSEGEVIENNALYGGGIYIETSGAKEELFGALNMANGKITKNKATSAASVKGSGIGGGVYIGNGSSFMMSGGDLASNTAATAPGVCVGTALFSKDKEIPEARFVISDKANIASDNSVYLARINVSHIQVTSALTAQKGAVTISLPAEMPQSMMLVKFVFGDKAEANESACRNAFTKKQFALDKQASEYFGVVISGRDKSVLINAAGESEPARAKTGKHYNGLKRYVEGDKPAAEGETKTEIVYGPVKVSRTGAFTAYYDFSYYPNLYENMNAVITAPFPEGTKIVMIDASDEKAVGFYYYEVSGTETVVSETEAYNGAKGHDTIEIPLINFYKTGTSDVFYDPKVNEDTSKKAMNTEKLLFIVDFVNVKEKEGFTLDGDYTMQFNHYFPGEAEGERYDISANIGQIEYTVSNASTSVISISNTDNTVKVTYSLEDNSPILANNKGVILFQLVDSTFPRGTYIVDAQGKQYLAASKSNSIAVSLPVDKDGKILAEGESEYVFKNYYGTAMVDIPIRAVIAPSTNGLHYTVGEIHDAQSEGIRLSIPALDSYSILVTENTSDNKPFYDGYETLSGLSALEMTVRGLINTTEATTFNLSLLKEKDGEYQTCALAELFDVSSDYGNEVVLNTGKLRLDLKADISSLMGNEYKIVFTVGDAVEYVKVNVTKEKK